MPQKQRQILLIISALILFPLIAHIDRQMGQEYDFTFFYLAIIVSLTWYGGKIVGYSLIAIGTLIILWFDTHRRHVNPEYGLVAWNTFWSMMTLFLGVLLVNRLRCSLQREQQLSRTDSLTGLPNRRSFDEGAERTWEWCKRHRLPITLGYLDLDNFKTVNDTRGHDEGDRVLIAVAALLQDKLRKTDLAARIGGDEFILFLPEADQNLSQGIVQRLQEVLNQQARDNDWPISASIGLVTDNSGQIPLPQLIQEADQLMYQVKTSGKGAMQMKLIPAVE